jgi:hypothetical protein
MTAKAGFEAVAMEGRSLNCTQSANHSRPIDSIPDSMEAMGDLPSGSGRPLQSSGSSSEIGRRRSAAAQNAGAAPIVEQDRDAETRRDCGEMLPLLRSKPGWTRPPCPPCADDVRVVVQTSPGDLTPATALSLSRHRPDHISVT